MHIPYLMDLTDRFQWAKDPTMKSTTTKAASAASLASLLTASVTSGAIRVYNDNVIANAANGNTTVNWDIDPDDLSFVDTYAALERRLSAQSRIGIYKYGYLGFVNDNSQILKISNLPLNATIGPGVKFDPGVSGIGYGFYFPVSASNISTSLLPGFTSGVSGYAGFVLDGPLIPIYGWAEMIITADGVNNSWEIVRWAIEDTGASIKVGQTAIPEPTTTVVGLGALALGAAGLRRWRKYKAAANQAE
ncbi:hypothetical protein [Rubellicoccus peritrichatus]|uniref:PEP-CTERM protein-sorting domain-containing protein n=1 Tax=Rubellicoccus peritrichatus TaxID=3080537 RepID=A0AAQ3LED0_9BACT|nr:hypothetical protein [Puniceicoccus sp. CR14]WOO42984.1 hypothetical protein RZN69_07755 [Puniceicoccus sp. CR14]